MGATALANTQAQLGCHTAAHPHRSHAPPTRNIPLSQRCCSPPAYLIPLAHHRHASFCSRPLPAVQNVPPEGSPWESNTISTAVFVTGPQNTTLVLLSFLAVFIEFNDNQSAHAGYPRGHTDANLRSQFQGALHPSRPPPKTSTCASAFGKGAECFTVYHPLTIHRLRMNTALCVDSHT